MCCYNGIGTGDLNLPLDPTANFVNMMIILALEVKDDIFWETHKITRMPIFIFTCGNNIRLLLQTQQLSESRGKCACARDEVVNFCP